MSRYLAALPIRKSLFVPPVTDPNRRSEARNYSVLLRQCVNRWVPWGPLGHPFLQPVYQAGGGAAPTDTPCEFGRPREDWKLVGMDGRTSGSMQVISVI